MKILLRDRKGFIYEHEIEEFQSELYLAVLKNTDSKLMLDTNPSHIHPDIVCDRVVFIFKEKSKDLYGDDIYIYEEIE